MRYQLNDEEIEELNGMPLLMIVECLRKPPPHVGKHEQELAAVYLGHRLKTWKPTPPEAKLMRDYDHSVKAVVESALELWENHGCVQQGGSDD